VGLAHSALGTAQRREKRSKSSRAVPLIIFTIYSKKMKNISHSALKVLFSVYISDLLAPLMDVSIELTFSIIALHLANLANRSNLRNFNKRFSQRK
jgi:hypothetical protein